LAQRCSEQRAQCDEMRGQFGEHGGSKFRAVDVDNLISRSNESKEFFFVADESQLECRAESRSGAVCSNAFSLGDRLAQFPRHFEGETEMQDRRIRRKGLG